MSKKNYYVTRRGDEWHLRREGADRASGVFDTQAAAIKRGNDLTDKAGGELRIQGRNRQFRDSDSHGNDPCPPRDRKH